MLYYHLYGMSVLYNRRLDVLPQVRNTYQVPTRGLLPLGGCYNAGWLAAGGVSAGCHQGMPLAPQPCRYSPILLVADDLARCVYPLQVKEQSINRLHRLRDTAASRCQFRLIDWPLLWYWCNGSASSRAGALVRPCHESHADRWPPRAEVRPQGWHRRPDALCAATIEVPAKRGTVRPV